MRTKELHAFTGHDLSEESKQQRLDEFAKFAKKVRKTGLVIVTQINDWQWRFEFASQKLDLYPVSRRVLDHDTLEFHPGKWALYKGMIEKHCMFLPAHPVTDAP